MPISLQTIYFWSAVIGGSLLLLQIVLSLFGGDADADADFDFEDADVGGGLSFRTVVAFLTFFGIAGSASHSAGLSATLSLVIAVVAGSLAFWLVGMVMLQLSKLRSSGNININNAVGAEAVIYLIVPAERSGTGAVTVPIQGRTKKFKAVTRGPALATGSLCKVVAVHAGDTLEVEAS